MTTFNHKSDLEIDDPKPAVLDDDTDSPSCSPAILTLHTSTPSSSRSSLPSENRTTPVAVSASHDIRPLSVFRNRNRSRSAPPFYEPSQLSVHNNHSSVTHSPPKNPPPVNSNSPPTIVIVHPKPNSPPVHTKPVNSPPHLKPKKINLPNDNSDDSDSNSDNNNNNKRYSSDNSDSSDHGNKSDKSNSRNTTKATTHTTSNKPTNKYKSNNNNDSDETQSEEEVVLLNSPSSSDTSDAENVDIPEKRRAEGGEKRGKSPEGHSPTKTHKGSHSDDDHHCSSHHHSDGDYADPDPKPTKKYKKGVKRWDQKRHFTIPDYGDENVPDDSYAAKVKRGLDEIYRIPGIITVHFFLFVYSLY